MPRVYLLTGRPGAGKTTIIREALTSLRVRAGGFYTEEIRTGGVRQGFQIVSLDGQTGTLSHVNIPGRYHVGKYGVNTDILDSIGVNAINHAIKEDALVVIDEIGKMELVSPLFREAVLKAITCGKKVLGTIMLNPHPYADEIKRRPYVEIIQVSTANRDRVPAEIVSWLRSTVDENNT
jgi:nucleoside-triphosphatase